MVSPTSERCPRKCIGCCTDPNSSGDAIEQTWASRLQAMQTGALEVEYRYIHPERGERVFYTKGRRMTSTPQLTGVVLDITDQKTAERQVAEQRQRFEFRENLH